MFIQFNSNINCGDYWSSPKYYFQDFLNLPQNNLSDLRKLNDIKIIIINGEINKKNLDEIKLFKKKTGTKVIGWALGLNHFDYTNDNMLISNIAKSRILNRNYFSDFDLVGHRDFGLEFDFDWVSCPSCLHPLFQKYKLIPPNKKIGVFYNLNMFKIKGIEEEDYMADDNFDLESKIKFLSNYEFVVTNSYHGVYWAQLLKRKVICLPVKYSLLNFRYPPVYLKRKNLKIAMKNDSLKLNKDVFESCTETPNFLDECIEANNKFHRDVIQII